MGARHVAQVLEHWAYLPEREFRCLLRMAFHVLDEPRDGKRAGLYWAGHELLAQTQRQPLAEGDDEESKRRRRNQLRDMRRVCGNLRAEGAVELVTTGKAVRDGHAQTYRLTLDRAGVPNPSSAGVHNPSPAGVPNPSQQGSPAPPRSSDREYHRESDLVPPSAGSRRGGTAQARTADERLEAELEELGIEEDLRDRARAIADKHPVPVAVNYAESEQRKRDQADAEDAEAWRRQRPPATGYDPWTEPPF